MGTFTSFTVSGADCAFDRTGEHVFYLHYDYYSGMEVHEHYLPTGGSSWVDNNWGNAYATSPFGMGLTSFSSSAFGEQLFAVGDWNGLHVDQQSGTKGLPQQFQDLTLGTNAPPVSADCAGLMTSFTDSSVWEPEDVFYVGNDGDLHHLEKVTFQGIGFYWWTDNNLTNGSFQPTYVGGYHCH